MEQGMQISTEKAVPLPGTAFQAEEQPMQRGNNLAWTSPAARHTVPQVPLHASPLSPTHAFPRSTNSSVQTLISPNIAPFYKFFSYSKIVTVVLLPWYLWLLYGLMLQNSKVTKVHCGLRVNFYWGWNWPELFDWSPCMTQIPGQEVKRTESVLGCDHGSEEFGGGLGPLVSLISWSWRIHDLYLVSVGDLQWVFVTGPEYLIRNLATWPATYHALAKALGIVLCTCSWFQGEKCVQCNPSKEEQSELRPASPVSWLGGIL